MTYRMKPHTWEEREVDGGPVGTGRFLHCTVCGAAGGPPFVKRPPKPFLAGPATPVSEDCNDALTFIRHYTRQRALSLKQMGSKGVSPAYGTMLLDAMGATRAKTDVTPILSLIYRIERFEGRPSIAEVRGELLAEGFRLSEPVQS